ncbi:MAG: tRNA threonylcarbamoyladenosine biosynthesis protein TsaB [Microbacteriaceae bacterium]|nr:tRNA threonylcarbamoyladenosine biosynthesis protein TsaB [Microbacteriaceae bacterium]
MLLAIDTSAGTSVAVVDRDLGTLVEIGEADTRRHAEVIGEAIRSAIDRSGVAASALSGVAIGMGPGPFTGLRVGIAAAQAFAFGTTKPLVRVVSHDAVAWGHYAAGNGGRLLVVTDARRREVYFSAYSGVDGEGLPVRVQGPGLCRPDDLADTVDGYHGFERLDAAEVSAASVGLLAEGLYLHRREFAGPEALYLRAPDATVSAGPKRVS